MTAPAESIDSDEFVDSIAGLFRDAERLAASAETIASSTERRLEAIRRNGFIRLVEVGEKLLVVHDQRPGEFEAWFELHRARFPRTFSLRTARRCKAAARTVREIGLEAAILQALGEVPRERPEPFLSLRLSLPVSPEQVPDDQVQAYLERLKPAVDVYHALEQRAPAAEET